MDPIVVPITSSGAPAVPGGPVVVPLPFGVRGAAAAPEPAPAPAKRPRGRPRKHPR
jgi:hypothetical protein